MHNRKSLPSKKDLFLELATPDQETGMSRWVLVEEFKDKYASLRTTNGGSWWRGTSALAKEYIIETERKGNRTVRIRTAGYQVKNIFNQNIHPTIRKYYQDSPCVMLGVKGNSENTKIEIDHKEGTKNNSRVSNIKTQRIDDFQPLSKAANDAKRQICKICQTTNIRFDATVISGYPEPYYKGGAELDKYGCEGCYQFDPVEYRKTFYSKKD